MNIWQRWKKTTVANKTIAASGAVVALGTIVSTGAVVVQLLITRENNRSTSEQVGKLIRAAEVQAGAASQIAAASDRTAGAADKSAQAASDFANYANGIEEQTKGAVIQFQRFADSAKESANAAGRAAAIAEQNAKLAQQTERAWVGVSSLSLVLDHPPPPRINDMLRIRVRFANTGRTPALNVKVASVSFIAPITRDAEGHPYGPVFGVSAIRAAILFHCRQPSSRLRRAWN